MVCADALVEDLEGWVRVFCGVVKLQEGTQMWDVHTRILA